MKCPKCGCGFAHLYTVDRALCWMTASPEMYGLPATGGGVAVIFAGECGHYWGLAFGDHKGNVFVRQISRREIERSHHLDGRLSILTF